MSPRATRIIVFISLAITIAVCVAAFVDSERVEASRPFEIGDAAEVSAEMLTLYPKMITFDAQGHAQLTSVEQCRLSELHKFQILAWADHDQATVEVWDFFGKKETEIPPDECKRGTITRIPRSYLSKPHSHITL